MIINKTVLTTGCDDPRIAFFDHLAPVWDRECSNPADTLQRLAALNGDLGLEMGQDVLELGCGTGQITGFLANRVCPGRVVAADFSPAMLAQARSRGVKAEFRQLDICCEGLLQDRFDIVLCFNAFPHFRDKPSALRQIGRCLKPSGCLTVLHLAGSAKLNAFHANLREPVCHDLLPEQQEWSGLLHDAGLCLASFTDQEDLFLLKAKRA
jgi:demethylmenaquinone methyltransferase/2-methoxy-6-polyprenyl-1,4-benzoquinol methylase